MIHKTAVIHPKAQLDSTVVVGPYAVIDEAVVVGPNCRIGPHVYLTGNTIIGANNIFHAGAVIGDAPQDLKYKDEPTRLRIGDHNVFREHATVHRSNKLAEDTLIGSHGFFMANSHVAHNCTIGDHVIIANGVLMAGHVTIANQAFVSGNCLIHQFVRIGTLALMQGGAGISKDLPPYTVARGPNHICGLNIIGLRRAGFTAEQRLELKSAYKFLFRSGQQLRQAVAEAGKRYKDPAARTLIEFVATTKRGICSDVGTSWEEDESGD
jgi:UDP-N-acetylglucosamine acyltransferase